MYCPRCGHKQYCPCTSCVERNPGEITYKWLNEGKDYYNFACGHCGLTKPGEWWERISYDSSEQFFDKTTDKSFSPKLRMSSPNCS